MCPHANHVISNSLADAKFPNQTGNGLPPSPTCENPGQVCFCEHLTLGHADGADERYSRSLTQRVPILPLDCHASTHPSPRLAAPQESVPGTGSEREPASALGNPYAFKVALGKLDVALEEAITAIMREDRRIGSSENENALLQKLQSWRNELLVLGETKGKTGSTEQVVTTQEGPMFTD